jgi:hypothetical protein
MKRHVQPRCARVRTFIFSIDQFSGSARLPTRPIALLKRFVILCFTGRASQP